MNVATCRKLRVISYANHPPSVRFFLHMAYLLSPLK